MAQNAVLAICAALWLGVPDAVIQERLAAWRPAQWRGETAAPRRPAGVSRLLQRQPGLDGRRAGQLRGVGARRPAARVRAGLHGGTGFPGGGLSPGAGPHPAAAPDDRLFIVGGHAAALREGVLENGPAAGQIVIAAGAAAVRPLLAYFPGAIFLKGSRRHHLEQALDLEEAAC